MDVKDFNVLDLEHKKFTITGKLDCYWQNPALYLWYRRNNMRRFKLTGISQHGKNRVREQGENVMMCPVPCVGGEMLVRHEDKKDSDGRDFVRWIKIDGNDKNFLVEERDHG